jgi:hypothetical protein
LTPWNIIIKKLNKPETFIYQFKDQIFRVTTNIVPIIIDYDKSHIIEKDIHYGINKPFYSSKIQDSFCLIIHSIYEFLHVRYITQNNEEYPYLSYIVNFFTETNFYPEKITNINVLDKFLKENKNI